MQKKSFEVIIEQDENKVYFAKVPQLPGCYTQADSLDELQENIKEAIQLVLEVSQEQARSYTEVFRVEVASA